MDKMTRHQVEKIKAAPVEPAVESPSPEVSAASPERKRARAEENEKNERRIQQIKKDLRLERGEMIIEPLEGDPFVLSRNHVSTGEGVTIYSPDGTVQKRTRAEYDAEFAKGLAAANYFKQRQPDSETEKTPVERFLAKGAGWLGGLFKKLIASFKN